jgi:hypothetical protein
MSFVGHVPKDVRGYINNGKHQTRFGLHRVLITMAVLRNSGLPHPYRIQLRDEILQYLTDPIFQQFIRAEVP